MNNFVKLALENGATIHPLIVPVQNINGPSITNPSIYNDNGKILVNLRNINYTLYHSEKKKFEHHWGPLVYIHPENDIHLRTDNFYCELNDDFEITRINKIDTSKFDTYEPMWDFVGLEDARLIRWNGKLYITGVRRDTTTNGQGRMELSEIAVSENAVTEISRFRIPPPKDLDSYCEKNWMPVLDVPYHYIKWTNPTELVSVDPILQTSKTEYLSGSIWLPRDIRGGSQVMKFKDGYIALTHEVDLFKSEVGRKDAVYRHRFIIWDKNWNVVKYTNDFSIMDAHVEFSIGMCNYKNDILITFGFQDNAAYLLKFPVKELENFINSY